MKYLKVFETEALQDAFMESGDYLQPHVSCLEDGSNVKFNKYSKEYYEMLNTPLTFEALNDQTGITFYQSTCAVTDEMPVLEIEISTDGGNTWMPKQAVKYNSNGHNIAISVTIDAGEKVLVRGNNSAYGYYSESEDTIVSNCSFFVGSQCYVYGNIMSLIDKNNFPTHKGLSNYAFPYLFCDYNGSLDASWFLSHPDKKFLLPALDLGDWCYAYLFSGCTSLTTAPKLPATTLMDYCYYSMFSGCTSLTIAPKLPATTLSSACYSSMFEGCTSLIIAPELPATTLANNCYDSMFRECTSLTSAPKLPAITLATHCYGYMFIGCTSLNYIEALFVTVPSTLYTNYWVAGVASTGTFVKNANAQWDETGDTGVPTGWTVVTENDGVPTGGTIETDSNLIPQ